ncbi:TRAP transporter substrate-binding protein [Azospira restricta]|uniref:TRAP transporter substrate-binding protein n=1 Tax=Azospira restricta TaxID=404405 RepID=A0A974PVK3_9RHOO|nr:TRAP transporter substrate-binding protein [Azospira restricta]QRJ62327.1 TRAP transporter substrate-binding protein [Azospira restricta]
MKKIVLALAAITGLGLSQTALAQEPVTIKFSHVLAVDTPKGKAAELFKKLAEERTKGRVRIEVYPNSILYKDKEEIEALQLGAVQMLAPALSKFGPLGIREFEVFDLPYVFDNYAELHKITLGPIGAGLLKKLEPKGITGLAYWDNGFKQMSSNKPMKKPEDAKGQKLRIPSSKVIDAQMRTLGAMPQTMAYSEVYQAMQTGVVDGSENTHSNLFTGKHHEVQKYLTLTDHGYLGYAVIVNKKFWDGLDPEIRKTLEGAMKDATTYNNEIAQKENDQALENVRKSGKTQVIALTPEEKQAWKKATMKVHEQFADKLGRDTLQTIYRETGFDPSGR